MRIEFEYISIQLYTIDIVFDDVAIVRNDAKSVKTIIKWIKMLTDENKPNKIICVFNWRDDYWCEIEIPSNRVCATLSTSHPPVERTLLYSTQLILSLFHLLYIHTTCARTHTYTYTNLYTTFSFMIFGSAHKLDSSRHSRYSDVHEMGKHQHIRPCAITYI